MAVGEEGVLEEMVLDGVADLADGEQEVVEGVGAAIGIDPVALIGLEEQV